MNIRLLKVVAAALLYATSSIGFAGLANASPIIFATQESNNTLYSMSPTTGALTAVGVMGAGSNHVTIAFAPNGTLYGVDSWNPFSGSYSLVKIDTNSGLATPVASLVGVVSTRFFTDIAFRDSDGALFGTTDIGGSGGQGVLWTIDTTTGVTTAIGSLPVRRGGGLAFAPDGTLYQTASGGVWTVDPSTAATSFIGGATTIGALDFDPSTGTLWAAGVNGSLGTIDTSTGAFGAVTNTATRTNIAIQSSDASVPEPSTIAVIGMALLSLFGFGLMRRRSET